MNKRIKKKIKKRYGAKHWYDAGYRKGMYLLSLHYQKEFNDSPTTKLPSEHGFDLPCITVSKNGKRLVGLHILKNAYPVSATASGDEIDVGRGNTINFHCFSDEEFNPLVSETVANMINTWADGVKNIHPELVNCCTPTSPLLSKVVANHRGINTEGGNIND